MKRSRQTLGTSTMRNSSFDDALEEVLEGDEADIALSEIGYTITHWAIVECNMDAIERLVAKFGRNVLNQKAPNGQTALHVFIHNKRETGENITQLKRLIELGGDMNLADNYGQTPMGILNRKKWIFAKAIIDDSIPLPLPDSKGVTLLMKAYLKGEIELARLLIARGANVNDADQNRYNALCYAALSCHIGWTTFKELLNSDFVYLNRNITVRGGEDLTDILYSISRNTRDYNPLERINFAEKRRILMEASP